MKKTELYFGTQKLDGTHVTKYEFQEFVDSRITPRFLSGFTVLEGTGQYQGHNGDVQKEDTFCVIILHEGVKVTDKLIDMIRCEYLVMCKQESVLRVDSIPCSVSF